MKKLGLIAVLACWGLLALATVDFPRWGDPASPAATHLSPRYIEQGAEATGAPNLVTAVLADYRGYDTMFETAVVFTAGMACFFLLRFFRKQQPEKTLYRHRPTGVVLQVKPGHRLAGGLPGLERIDSQWTPYDPITSTASRVLIPFIQIFALYVVAHGHHSPGGGFQGGVILGASFILLALSQDLRTAQSRLGEKANVLASSLGVLIYVGVGCLALVWGANFLDYAALAGPLGVEAAQARSLGILFVEIGVAVAVMATMFLIYRVLVSAGALDEGL